MSRRAVIPVTELEKYNIARELIRGGLRISTVEMLTGLSVRWLREAHKEINGTAPLNGRVPSNCLHFIKSVLSAQRLSAFVTLYKQQHGTVQVDAKNLLATWKAYERLCGEFDINAGFYGCRDVLEGIVVMMACQECHMEYIYDISTRYTDCCPYCRTQPF